MAVTTEDRPCPAMTPFYTGPEDLAPIQAGQPLSQGISLRPACPLPASGPPRPVFPSTDEERVSGIDQQTLANLRSFGSQPLGYSPGDVFEKSTRPLNTMFSRLSALQPLTTAEGRRQTVASPGPRAGLRLGFGSPASPSVLIGSAGRRRSAPSTHFEFGYIHSHWDSREPASRYVVPRQLDRPQSPAILPCGAEIWWPIQPNGDIKVHVTVVSRSGIAEKLTRCYHTAELQSPTSSPTSALQSSPPESAISLPAPGSVLPVPGSVPQVPSSATTPGRRMSFACSPALVSPRSPLSGRRALHNEFVGEYIDKGRASELLPILGAILVQTKRPIQGDEMVNLPLPFPHAWFETVRYVYTRDEEFLSESVKRNILHLGGRI